MGDYEYSLGIWTDLLYNRWSEQSGATWESVSGSEDELKKLDKFLARYVTMKSAFRSAFADVMASNTSFSFIRFFNQRYKTDISGSGELPAPFGLLLLGRKGLSGADLVPSSFLSGFLAAVLGGYVAYRFLAR